ncbi:protein S100-A9-like [Mus pahari]|uniref:protein S100-A9-like n=1 Tax=Mus pahari TaxID=10093 RepID=UPI000A30A57A|nr:protein S100-A9-like [Mus pahari]
MDQQLTPSECNIMMLYRIFDNYTVRKVAELTEKEFKQLVRSEFPYFLKDILDRPLNRLLNEPKDHSFEEALDMIGRIGMVYYKKMNNIAFEH